MMNTDTVLFNDKHMLVWTETADYGFEDVIVVSVRYLHPTGSPENIDSYDDVAAAVRDVMENYPVDTDRMYWIGNSLGSMTSPQTVARYPELADGVLTLNGLADFSYDFSDEAKAEEYKGGAMEVLKVLADNDIALYMQLGEKDYTGCNALAGETYYELISDYYHSEKGYSNEQIKSLVKLKIFPSEDFYVTRGLTDHNVTRYD